MRSRIDFAWHLRRSILVPMPQSSGLSAAVLPLPLLSSSSWCWKSHVGLSKLDLLFLGRYPALEELSRRPTAAQSEIIAWLRSQLAVCRFVEETFPLAPGRAGPELSAALLQLEVCCWLSGVSTRLP